jgi:hypothetical protein
LSGIVDDVGQLCSFLGGCRKQPRPSRALISHISIEEPLLVIIKYLDMKFDGMERSQIVRRWDLAS